LRPRTMGAAAAKAVVNLLAARTRDVERNYP
jgi:hypothetical protein